MNKKNTHCPYCNDKYKRTKSYLLGELKSCSNCQILVSLDGELLGSN